MLGLDNFVNNITGFFETKIELLKLDIQERISSSLTGLVHLVITVLVLFLVVLFLGLALGFGLGSLLNSNFFGFLIVGTIFGVLLFFLNKKLIKGIIDKEIENSINQLFKVKKDGNSK